MFLAALKFGLAALFAAGLAAFPAEALAAATEAMAVWAGSVAPVLFPFAVMTPYLSCSAARRVYDRLMGGIVRRLFGLPGGCASAIMVGLIAGSPAGAIAVRNIAAGEGLTGGQAARLAGIACGVSPMFTISVMGMSLAGSVQLGRRFAAAQLIAQLITGILFRRAFYGMTQPVAAVCTASQDKPVASGIAAVLRVCGYMVMFSTGLAVGKCIMGNAIMFAAPVFDLPTGLAILAAHDLPYEVSAFALGFAGLCIAGQNIGVLGTAGVGWREYIPQKIVSACLCTVVFSAINHLNLPHIPFGNMRSDVIFEYSVLLAVLILMPVTLFYLIKGWKKHIS